MMNGFGAMRERDEYSISELQALTGLSGRTVRYYVQEGLLPAPLGVGRGQHYGAAHLERLLEVKRLQQIGRALDEIRRELRGEPAPPAARRQAASVRHSVWRRLVLLPGVELHVAAAVPLPPAAQLDEITRALRRAFASASDGQEDGDA